MFIKDWKKEIFTIPNLLSLFRLVLIPVYAYIYLHATEDWQYLIAGTIMAVSCITDMIDGKIARRFNMISTLGKILDPLADKITQFTLTLCLSLKYPILYPVLALFLVKELFQVIAGISHLRTQQATDDAKSAAKDAVDNAKSAAKSAVEDAKNTASEKANEKAQEAVNAASSRATEALQKLAR